MLDQQITSAIVNKKDHLLRKGNGYHLDLIIVALLIVICATFGLPFYIANTVISLMHVESLKIYTTCNAPGEKAQLLGIKFVLSFIYKVSNILLIFLESRG